MTVFKVGDGRIRLCLLGDVRLPQLIKSKFVIRDGLQDFDIGEGGSHFASRKIPGMPPAIRLSRNPRASPVGSKDICSQPLLLPPYVTDLSIPTLIRRGWEPISFSEIPGNAPSIPFSSRPNLYICRFRHNIGEGGSRTHSRI